MLKQYKLKDYDFRLVAYVVVLTIIGILVIGSANSSVQGKQILGLVLGLITMVVVSLMDYEFLLRFSWIFYFINIVLLTLVLIMGDKSKGATRWVEIAGIRFQPSELGKILLKISGECQSSEGSDRFFYLSGNSTGTDKKRAGSVHNDRDSTDLSCTVIYGRTQLQIYCDSPCCFRSFGSNLFSVDPAAGSEDFKGLSV